MKQCKYRWETSNRLYASSLCSGVTLTRNRRMHKIVYQETANRHLSAEHVWYPILEQVFEPLLRSLLRKSSHKVTSTAEKIRTKASMLVGATRIEMNAYPVRYNKRNRTGITTSLLSFKADRRKNDIQN